MSNGGYKGNTPARETSPEQYPGVWELTEQFQAQADGNWPFQETDCAPKSLRFDGSSAPSSFLSRTPPTASDRRTWSWSAWIKRGKISSEACIFTAGASTANTIRFNSNGTLKVNAGSDGSVETVASFRDPSAWLHLLVVLQTGAVTDSDRLKIYVNNVLQTVTGTYPTKDGQGFYNAASVHYVGRQVHNESNLFDGCIADLQFIDGQALDPDAFTFIDGQGVLQPKRFTGDYSFGGTTTNTTDDVYAWGLTYDNIGGAGGWYFTTENNASSLGLSGNTGGHADELGGNTIGQRNGEDNLGAWGTIATLNSYTAGQSARSMSSNSDVTNNGNAGGPISFVWNKTNGKVWVFATGDSSPIGGGNPNTPTSTPTFSLPTTGRVAFGFVSASNGEEVTLQAINSSLFSGSHTLPKWRGVYDHTLSNNKATSTATAGSYRDVWSDDLNDNTLPPTVGRNSFHLDFSDSSADAALGYDSSGVGNDWTPNNFSALGGVNYSGLVQGTLDTQYGSSDPATPFNGSTGNSYSDGIRPTGGNYLSINFGTLFTNATTVKIYGHASLDGVSYSGANENLKINGTALTSSQWADNGGGTGSGQQNATFTLSSGLTSLEWGYSSGSQSTGYLYLQGIEVDGVLLVNGSPSDRDCLLDSPVNGNQTDPSGLGGIVQGNYATWNPLVQSTSTYSEGNLKVTTGANVPNDFVTIYTPAGFGKWYWEFEITALGGTNYTMIGMLPSDSDYVQGTSATMHLRGGISYYAANGGINAASGAATTGTAGATFGIGDVIGWAFDAQNGTLQCYKNGASQGTQFTNIRTDVGWVFCAHDYMNYSGSSYVINFGQRAFKHPLAGYKSLCTSNLPEPSIPVPSQYFDTKVWSGNSSARSITGYNFAPSFAWIKRRNASFQHVLQDVIRGTSTMLSSNDNNGEAAFGSPPLWGYINAFNSDGFSLATGGNGYDQVNVSGSTYVAYSWDAGDATTTTAAGSLNSSLYNQSQTWSSGGSISNSGENPVNYTNTFDGIISGVGAAPNYAEGWRIGGTSLATGTSTVSGLNIAFSESVKVRYFKFIYSGSNSNTQFKINNVSLLDGTATTSTYQDIDVTSSITSPITSLEINRNAGNNNLQIAGIYIDGKLLVDSGVSITTPSIASTVRANPTAGFSIIKASTDSTNTIRTVAHNLGKEPEFIISKNLEWADQWFTYHKDIQTDNKQYMNLNSYTGRASSGSTIWGHTPHVMGFNGALWVPGGDTDEIIFYCFTSVEGYSKISSYVGSGNSQFIHCGFTPAWIMIKRYTDNTVGQWSIYNTASSPNNEVRKKIWADDTASEENHPNNSIDIVSNGFVIDPGGDAPNVQYTNTGSVGYLYMAIAESPFKTARAR